MAVCDAYDAMTSNRPYREAMSQEKAEAILRKGAGSQWDPGLIQAFLGIMPTMIKLRERHNPRVAGRGEIFVREFARSDFLSDTDCAG